MNQRVPLSVYLPLRVKLLLLTVGVVAVGVAAVVGCAVLIHWLIAHAFP
ncbi:MAG: hypothetical protein WC485_12440 [Opitutaceae bacterium]